MKKDSGLFNVPMGAFDGAEVFEPVSNFLFIKLSEKYKRKSLALYRDDGLTIFKNVIGPALEKIEKICFCELFRETCLDDLEHTIQCNRRKVVNS